MNVFFFSSVRSIKPILPSELHLLQMQQMRKKMNYFSMKSISGILLVIFCTVTFNNSTHRLSPSFSSY